MTVKFSSEMTFSKIALYFLMDPRNRPTKKELCRYTD